MICLCPLCPYERNYPSKRIVQGCGMYRHNKPIIRLLAILLLLAVLPPNPSLNATVSRPAEFECLLRSWFYSQGFQPGSSCLESSCLGSSCLGLCSLGLGRVNEITRAAAASGCVRVILKLPKAGRWGLSGLAPNPTVGLKPGYPCETLWPTLRYCMKPAEARGRKF
jgi:hypothetical protein